MTFKLPTPKTDMVKKSCSYKSIGHFTVMDGSEVEGDLVLIQTVFALLWKLFFPKTRSIL